MAVPPKAPETMRAEALRTTLVIAVEIMFGDVSVARPRVTTIWIVPSPGVEVIAVVAAAVVVIPIAADFDAHTARLMVNGVALDRMSAGRHD